MQFIQGDFREETVLAQLKDALRLADGSYRTVDLVVSDMAPNLSGVDSVDAARIEHLVELAVDFTREHVRCDGALVVKLFHGGAYAPLVKLFKDTFRCGQAHQAQVVARQIVGNLFGGFGSEMMVMCCTGLMQLPCFQRGFAPPSDPQYLKPLKWPLFSRCSISSGAFLEQPVVFQSGGVDGHRYGAVYRLQAV